MVRYPEVWVADYLQNMRSRRPSMRNPAVNQVSRTRRERADIGLTLVTLGQADEWTSASTVTVTQSNIVTMYDD